MRSTLRPGTVRGVDRNDILTAEFIEDPEEWGIKFKRERRRSGVRRRGLVFEHNVQESLVSHYPDFYVPNPWIRLRLRSQRNHKFYQPDGLYLDFNRRFCIIVEVKLSHTSDAWWQVTKQYVPAIQHIFLGWDIAVVEICCGYDPHVIFPVDISTVYSIAHVQPGQFRFFLSRKRGKDVK